MVSRAKANLKIGREYDFNYIQLVIGLKIQ
jgi:hypothetical protein